MSGSTLPKYLRHADKLQNSLKTKSERHWTKRGEQMALQLFRDMAERVPAYKDFLALNKFDPRQVKTIKDFEKIPVVDKDNYLRKYERKDLCWDGEFDNKRWVISTTSGSTGEPFYFPRTDLQDEYYALTAELYLRENFQIQNKSTLYIDAFAMGAWIGGLFTYEAVKQVAEKGYKLSIITPGINKAEVLNSVRQLGKNFDQVIIGCYPPILKDIIDLGLEDGIDWSDYNLGVVFSAEGFTEQFRDYIVKHAKLANPYTSTLNHYGTVDLGTMSHETPLSILVRRQAVASPQIFKSLFPNSYKQPTFTQYIPEMFYFEEIDGNVICSSNSGIPLVRYDLKDRGGVMSIKQIEKAFRKTNKNVAKEVDKAGITGKTWNLPFVYLFERADFSVTFLAAQIYPEEIRQALLDENVYDKVTGKITLEVSQNKKMESKLVVHVELRRGLERNIQLNRAIKRAVTSSLLGTNTEYASSYKSVGRKAHPQIILWPNTHPLHFSGQGKQRWVKK